MCHRAEPRKLLQALALAAVERAVCRSRRDFL